jgi:Arrestin (or S-antigen), N-terminal domain
MGNSAPRIAIRVDHDAIVAGNTLRGRIFLSANGSADHSARGIKMTLYGFEQSIIVREQNKNGNMQKVRECVKSSIIDNDATIKTFSTGVIPGGQYEIPFEWQIPDWLPSTMKCSDRIDDCSCSIEYYLKVYLDRFDCFGEKSEVSSTIPISIFGASNSKESKIIMDCERFNLKACCCSNRGVITMGWDASSTVVAPGERITVGIIGKNDSIEKVQHLLAEVIETITWTANGHSKNHVRNVASKKFEIDRNALWLPISKLPTRYEMRNLHYEAIPLDNNPEILAGKKVGNFILNHDTRDSYDGKVIEVRHSLVITAVTPCCITSPQSSALIRVQRCTLNSSIPNATPFPSAPISEDDILLPSSQIESKATDQPPLALAEILPTNWNPQESCLVVIQSNSMIPQDVNTELFVPYQDEGQPSAPEETIWNQSYEVQSQNSFLDIQRLFKETRSLSDAFALSISQPELVTTFQSLSPHEFIETLKLVDDVTLPGESQASTNARLLALFMGQNFRCCHALACLWGLPDPTRFEVFREVIPLASDLASHKKSFEKELTPKEMEVFREALLP